MEVLDTGGQRIEDDFPFEVFKQPETLQTDRRVALFDPKGLTGPWISKLGLRVRLWKPGDSLEGVDLLIIGREAMQIDGRPLFTPQDIGRGLRVLVMEQQPAVWKDLGFKITDAMPRYVFARAKSSPILWGLEPQDLVNWRGSANLLPESVDQPHDVLHAPKWTNRHAVASVALQIPEIAGFLPVLACEFDMNYSPLLQCRFGSGQITLCSLDLTGRVGSDPAATLLARNLLQEELSPTPRLPSLQSAGDLGSISADFGVDPSPLTEQDAAGKIVLAGAGIDDDTYHRLNRMADEGATILQLPLNASELQRRGYAVVRSSLYQAQVSRQEQHSEQNLLDAIGPSLLRWRDHLDVDAFSQSGQPAGSTVLASGLVLVQDAGKGRWIYCQAGPQLLAGRYAGDLGRTEAIQASVQRLSQLEAQILTNTGVGVAQNVVRRLAQPNSGPKYDALESWRELGPFPFQTDDGEAMLDTKFPGEESAIAGDVNAVASFQRSDGVVLNWNQTVDADAAAHVDLAREIGPSGLAVAYFVTRVPSPRDRTAILRLGVDYRIAVWVNHVPVFQTVTGAPRPNAFSVPISLKAGDNLITLKIGSGSKGFGFWADLSEDNPRTGSDRSDEEASLYHPLTPDFDPYEFRYW